MTWLAAAAAWWMGGAAAAWLVRRQVGWAAWISAGTTLAGAGCLGVAAVGAMSGAPASLTWTWGLPFGDFALRLDPLSGVFLMPISLIGALGAIFAPGYLRRDHGGHPIGSWLSVYPLLLASMALVVVAANTVLLLTGWELMTILSWYLLTSHHEERPVRGAGLIYLIAGHMSGAALLLLFVLLSQVGGDWRIPAEPLGIVTGLPPKGLLFGLAIVGFGTKASIAPLHFWLPDAHAAAPSHVSALMSGVLITLGFYGLLRFAVVLGPLPSAWGVALIGLGVLGACGGIVMALSQRDVKRILAYSTIENAGLVTLAVGLGLLGSATGRPVVAALAWTAALLHVWNHAISKSLLFFAAGAIAERVRSRDLERWGGLLRRLPLYGTALLAGAASIAGLPGTHGFASEWLLFLSLFRGSLELPDASRVAMLLGVAAVAFVAGATLACFVRLAGIGLLGHARSEGASTATSTKSSWIAIPIVVLSISCFALVIPLQLLLALLGPAVELLAPGADMASVRQLAAPLPWLAAIPIAGIAAAVLGRALIAWRRPVRVGETWGCGYSNPAPTMQYTATSLAQPITRVLQPALRTTVRWTPPQGLWPGSRSWEARTPERAFAELYRPTFERLVRLLGLLTRLQEGRVMVYLRYVGFATLALLAWLFLPMGGP